MKKITLLAAAFLLFNAAPAQETKTPVADRHANISFDEPIAFTERGIQFFVFPNGEFDFNTEVSTGSEYYRNGRRTTVNTTYGAPGSTIGVRIEHDAQGRVRRIGNVFVNYDRDNRIKRIGNVYMTYDRNALIQVGGLRIVYDRRGNIVDTIGSVNGYTQYAYNDYYHGPAEGNNNYDHYYYRQSEKK